MKTVAEMIEQELQAAWERQAEQIEARVRAAGFVMDDLPSLLAMQYLLEEVRIKAVFGSQCVAIGPWPLWKPVGLAAIVGRSWLDNPAN